METKEELRIVSEQLHCAAAQKYHLQEKLCRFEVLGQRKYYVTLITIIILVHNYVIHNHEKECHPYLHIFAHHVISGVFFACRMIWQFLCRKTYHTNWNKSSLLSLLLHNHCHFQHNICTHTLYDCCISYYDIGFTPHVITLHCIAGHEIQIPVVNYSHYIGDKASKCPHNCPLLRVHNQIFAWEK